MDAPTVAEITAGTDLSRLTPVDGVGQDITENEVTTPLLGDKFIVSDPGTWSARNTMTFMRHKAAADDDAWTLFQADTTGYLLVSRFAPAAALARVEVYHVRVGKRRMNAAAQNEHQKFEVTMYSQEAPALDAAVVA
jgi:hypothetical protein